MYHRSRLSSDDRLSVYNKSEITIRFISSTQQSVAWLGTSLFADKIDTLATATRFRIPKLMLTEGVYQIKIFAKVDGESADEIFDAAQLEVVYHDYFSTGKVPIKDFSVVGHTFLDYDVSWK